MYLWVRSRAFHCDEYRASRALLFGKRAKRVSMVKDPCFFFLSRLKHTRNAQTHTHSYTHIRSLFKIPKTVFDSQFPSGNRRLSFTLSAHHVTIDRRTEGKTGRSRTARALSTLISSYHSLGPSTGPHFYNSCMLDLTHLTAHGPTCLARSSRTIPVLRHFGVP